MTTSVPATPFTGPAPAESLERAATALRDNNFDVEILEHAAAARTRVNELVPDGATQTAEIWRMIACPEVIIGSLAAVTETGSLVAGSASGDWCAANVSALEIERHGLAGHHTPEDQPEAITSSLITWMAKHRLLSAREA